MEAVPTVVDAWRDELEGGPVLTFDELASVHSSGLKVLALSSSPIHTEILEPQRVAGAVTVARRHVDYVLVDLHPSYSPLNRALFDRSDRIMVPVTPDLPAIRALIQLRDVAEELGMRDRLSLIVNRANSGVSVLDLEKAIGMPAYSQIRSDGLLLVRAANEGRTAVEMAPREKIVQDFNALADRVMGLPEPEPALAAAAVRAFGRPRPDGRSRAEGRPAAPGQASDAPRGSARAILPAHADEGCPAGFWCRSPVRLSTCSTPRR